MPKPKGSPKTGGRKKGTPNRLTADIKTAIEAAFQKVGGEDFLVKVANDDPRTFCALLGRVLPAQLEHSGRDGAPIDMKPDQMSALDIARRIAFALQDARRRKQHLEETRHNAGARPGAVPGKSAADLSKALAMGATLGATSRTGL